MFTIKKGVNGGKVSQIALAMTGGDDSVTEPAFQIFDNGGSDASGSAEYKSFAGHSSVQPVLLEFFGREEGGHVIH